MANPFQGVYGIGETSARTYTLSEAVATCIDNIETGNI